MKQKLTEMIPPIHKYIQKCWALTSIPNECFHKKSVFFSIEYENPSIVANSILFGYFFVLFKLMDLATKCVHDIVKVPQKKNCINIRDFRITNNHYSLI